MTDELSAVAAGDAAGGPVPLAPESPVETPREPSQPRRSIFDRRSVPSLSTEERAVRTDAIERSLQFGAEPVRDGRGWALEVDFSEANREAVEPWKHDRRDKRFYRRSQQAAKAAGQLIGQPGDRIELATRFARLHRREGSDVEGSDVEGAVRRGLFDAIWRFDHVYDSYTVPRRYGTHIMKTGRVAAVAEEQRRKWQAEGLAPADAFWVRNRRNTGLVLVSPNPDPDAPSSEEILGGEGDMAVVGQLDLDQGLEPLQGTRLDDASAEASDPEVVQGPTEQLSYADILITSQLAPSKTLLPDGSRAPVINLEADRIANILADEPAVFEIVDSPTASGREPIHALHDKGYWAVYVHEEVIEHEAKEQHVDPDLVKAIMYLENAHGASYGRVAERFGWADTILPMNIDPEIWGDLVGQDADFFDPLVNVKAGVALISRIQARIESPTVAKVASPYKFTGRELVSDYGARVAEIYTNQLWKRLPPALTDMKLRQRRQSRAELEGIIARFERKKDEIGERLAKRRPSSPIRP